MQEQDQSSRGPGRGGGVGQCKNWICRRGPASAITGPEHWHWGFAGLGGAVRQLSRWGWGLCWGRGTGALRLAAAGAVLALLLRGSGLHGVLPGMRHWGGGGGALGAAPAVCPQPGWAAECWWAAGSVLGWAQGAVWPGAYLRCGCAAGGYVGLGPAPLAVQRPARTSAGGSGGLCALGPALGGLRQV